jgi:hypothetical protein
MSLITVVVLVLASPVIYWRGNKFVAFLTLALAVLIYVAGPLIDTPARR